MPEVLEQIQKLMNAKFKEIAEKLPTLTHQDPSSFSCGFNAGYKQCLLDLMTIIDVDK